MGGCFVETEQIIVFKLQEQEFGINIAEVLEVQNYSTIRSIPGVAKYVEGIINVRGTVYSIINLHTRLGLMPCEEESNSKFILLDLESPHVGFVVDSVAEILTVDKSAIEQSQQVSSKDEVSCVKGIIKKQDRIILILDRDVILSDVQNIVLQDKDA